jgi:hypothetical protein
MTDSRRPKPSDPTAERSSDPLPDGKDITDKKEHENEARPGRDEAHPDRKRPSKDPALNTQI